MRVMNNEILALERIIKTLNKTLNLSKGREQKEKSRTRVLKDEVKELKNIYKKAEQENKKAREELEKENKKLKKKVKAQAEKIASLKKNSSTSSIKGSSEIVKPKKAKKKGKGKRKKGGQKGHKRHIRKDFTSDEIDENIDYILSACPDCNGVLELQADGIVKVQQVELVEKPIEVTEHTSYTFWCVNCQKFHTTQIPGEIKNSGLCGPRLMALIAFLKAGLHASFNSIRVFLRDVFGIKFAKSFIYKLIRKTSLALLGPYEELLNQIPLETKLNVDETGHKNNGERFWTWCFRAQLFVLFRIKKNRSSKILIETLGTNFKGIIGCDYFSAYRKFMKDFNITIQFCLAHLIRDIRFLTTLPNKKEKEYGKKLLAKIKELFKLIHDNEEKAVEGFKEKLIQIKKEFLDIGINKVPLEYNTKGKEKKSKSRNLYIRFKKHGDEFFQFITSPEMDPTNNIAEQAIRFIVIDRHITQGTRSEDGMENNERIWTVMGTCAIQGKSAYQFIKSAIKAAFNPALQAPTLIPIYDSD